MAAADSLSHHVYVGPDVVVKVIDATRHSRLDREIALAPHLPAGLTASLLASGYGSRERPKFATPAYAAREDDSRDGPAGADGATACLLAEQAMQRLGGLHRWVPAGLAELTLGEPLDHAGSSARPRCLAEVENLAALDRGAFCRPACSTG